MLLAELMNALLVSLVSFLVGVIGKYWRERTLRAKQARAKEEVEQVRKQSEMQLEKFSQIDPPWKGLLGSLISTSTAQAPAGIAEGNAAIDELRNQISVIEQKIQTHRNEIVEVTKIDPVLEATIKASIENLTKRIEFLEKTRLEKWDVALIVFQVFSGLGVIFAIIFGIIKYLHP